MTRDDIDSQETSEWVDSIESVITNHGPTRAHYILSKVMEVAQQHGVTTSARPFSAYCNSISLDQQPAYPGDLKLEKRIASIIRWNALVMVVRANQAYGELGGHIASYASAAEIFETGFNHFFRARTADFLGDLIYFQPHSAPGIYARAFLEGRLSEKQIANFRQETSGNGLCSYPHPWLMKDFWQFPTGSMGIGVLNSIYQARFMRYLEARGLAHKQNRHVWGVFGDGEMDEPDSIAGLTLAAREELDNLTFIINCNLQRLDGPVRSNGQIIPELEALFVGAGWNVIKVLWGSEWDVLFARDKNYVLLSRFAKTVDGQYQDLGAKDGSYNREKFFNLDVESAALVRHMSNVEIDALKRGGHDFKKLYAAFAAAKAHKNQPTVILAKTKKGYGMGEAGESKMKAHQTKKLDLAALLKFRDHFELPLTNKAVETLQFYKPDKDSAELTYIKERRAALGGYLPKRFLRTSKPSLPRAKINDYAQFALQANDKEMSTTLAAVRILSNLLKDQALGPNIVPIVADEARTFGMESLFRQIGIYAPKGQLYEPEDKRSLAYYKEEASGQLIEEGITEAGAISTWTAAGTSYSIHNVETLPVYIYYSMFGFQRVGDHIWAAADQRARGFLLGATAGRTTLSGEGLQHQDGSSHVQAASISNCRAYDPTFAYELAVIMEYGMQRMLDEKRDEFFYITVMNEKYRNPSIANGVEAGIIQGLYKLKTVGDKKTSLKLIGSGAILLEVLEAAELLFKEYSISSDVYSATSFTELSRQAAETERLNRLTPLEPNKKSYLNQLLDGPEPIIVATDYIRALPSQIAPYLDKTMTILGTDGFGRSDNRKALRSFFEVDCNQIAASAMDALVRQGRLKPAQLDKAYKSLPINTRKTAPWNC